LLDSNGVEHSLVGGYACGEMGFMNFSTHYQSGEEIRAGDRVLCAGKPGRVVFVLGSGNLPTPWSENEKWFREKYGTGFMLDTEWAGPVFQHESDEDLQFLGREE
jgi:hypothetical protein